MDKNKVERAYKEIQKTVNYFVKVNPFLLKESSREDLVQEIYCHFLEKKFFEKYDERITSFEYFCARAAKNHLIDMVRKGIEKNCSLNESLGEDGETQLQDVIEDRISDQYSSILFKQLMENCSEEQCSPYYKLSWKELLGYVIEGWTPSEIHQKIGVSSSRICQLISILREKLNGLGAVEEVGI